MVPSDEQSSRPEPEPGTGKKWKRRTFIAALGAGSVAAAAVSFFGFYKFSAPHYSGAITDHFNGERFFNPEAQPRGFVDLMRWLFNRKPGIWTLRNDIQPGPPPPKRVGRGKLRVTFVNHSTVLIQVDGLNILTDPVWSYRISPVSFAGPSRYKPAGIRLEDLPPIDVLLVSHNHYDHMDTDTLRRLVRKHKPRIYVPLGNKVYLDSEDIPNSSDMDWWDTADIGNGVRLSCVPAQHFSGRGLGDRDATLWCGFMLETSSGPVYFAADTGVGAFFDEIRDRFPNIRLALLPIGAYEPRWFMSPVHMGPDDAAHVHRRIGAQESMGIHFGTFAQADDGEDDPVKVLHAELDKLGIPREQFRALGNGESWEVA